MKFLISIIFLMLISCGSATRSVARVHHTTSTDLSGKWNDTDSRMVAEKMVGDVLKRPWLADFKAENEKKPTVIISKVKNRTSEHINTSTFIKDIERELINSGRVKFVATKSERGSVRSERLDQQSNSSFETAKQLANETGADFMMIGTISNISDSAGGDKVVYYQIDLELINIESNEKVWIGNEKIKKVISKDGYKL